MENLILDYGLYAYAIALFFDDLGFFFPTTAVLFSTSIYSHHHPEFSILSIFLISILIPPVSNRILFIFGRYGGRKWLMTHGYKIFLPIKRIKKAEKFLEKYGEKTIFLTSVVTTIRPFSSLIAGSLNMDPLKFSIFNFLGTLVWATFVITIGYTFGSEIWEFTKSNWRIIVDIIIIYTVLHYLYFTIKKIKMTKSVLVIGNGGREHAICDALVRSEYRVKIFNMANSINPGIKKISKEVCVGDIMNSGAIKAYAEHIKPDFCIIGPDDPIGIGIADELQSIGIPCFAPTKKCAQLEGSKSFTRNLLKKYNIDASPDFEVFENKSDTSKMKKFYDKYDGQIVVKADGLLGGKGVLVAGDHFKEFNEAEEFAQKSIKKFGRVVLEEKLIGEEFSLISIVDGYTVLDCPAIQDHKRAFEGDLGPNTGGMGCISDENHSLPFLTAKDLETAHEITVRTMEAVKKETGERFVGIMYGGFMVTKRGVKLIEYNARFGDPEALNILPILRTDFVKICEKAIKGELNKIKKLDFRNKATVVKYLCPEGYPTNPIKNVPLQIKKLHENANQKIFMASVAEENKEVILKGSRAIGVVGIGDTIEEANENCEDLIPHFSGPIFYRKDIGTKELIQKRINHMKKIRGGIKN